MARCSECDFDWESERSSVVAELAEVGSMYRISWARAETAGLPVKERLSPNVWSGIEYLAHLRDVLVFYLDRIQAVLTIDRPTMPSVRFDSLAEIGEYRHEDAPRVLDEIGRSLDAATQELLVLEPSHWERFGYGSSGDKRTVLDLARRMVHESQHHLLDIEREFAMMAFMK